MGGGLKNGPELGPGSMKSGDISIWNYAAFAFLGSFEYQVRSVSKAPDGVSLTHLHRLLLLIPLGSSTRWFEELAFEILGFGF